MTRKRNISEYHQLPILGGLELLDAKSHTLDFPFHVHDTFNIALITENTFYIRLEDKDVVVPRGALSIVHPNEVHATPCDKDLGNSFFTYYVSPETIVDFNGGQPVYFEDKVIYDQQIFSELYYLSTHLNHNEIDFENRLIAALKLLVSTYASVKPIKYATSKLFQSFMVESNFESFSLDKTASQFGMNKYKFIRLFKQETGLTPNNYVLLSKIQESKNMLKQGKPIFNTAIDCGFYDLSHFYKNFKRFTGVNPLDFQNSFIIKQCNILQQDQLRWFQLCIKTKITPVMKQLLIFLFLLSSIISRTQEVIPFELGEDNRIYIKGCINQSDTLHLVFDLGANITVINKTSMEAKNVNINFDTVVVNGGGNGSSNESKSFNNVVKIGTHDYTGRDVLGISYPENEKLDGLIGWNFFENKIVEIDYESKELLISDNLPEYFGSYSKVKLKFINHLPYIKTIIYKGKKKVKIWSMLDTGYNDVLKVYYDPVVKNKLMNQYQVIGESSTWGTDGNVSKADWVLIPKFEIGGFEIYNMPTHLLKTKVDSDIPALLGGNLLKRFHIILDFEKKLVYVKPNSNINSNFQSIDRKEHQFLLCKELLLKLSSQ